MTELKLAQYECQLCKNKGLTIQSQPIIFCPACGNLGITYLKKESIQRATDLNQYKV